MDFVKFCQNCQEVNIEEGIVTFTGYTGEREDYHTDRGYWVIPVEEVVELVKENMEEWSEC